MNKKINNNKNDLLRPKTIVIAGSARLPENITAKHVFGFFSIELEIDPKGNIIVDCSCTLVPNLGQKIIYNALLGNEIEAGIKKAIEEVDQRFYSVTKRAVIAALEDAYSWYKRCKIKKQLKLLCLLMCECLIHLAWAKTRKGDESI